MTVYRFADFDYKYSKYTNLEIKHQHAILKRAQDNDNLLVDIIAYCIMPTHIHLILKQNTDKGITKFMAKILNSYSRYFNIRHHRAGPLWEGHFKNVLVKNDEQIYHLSRYIHLNPYSAGLVDDLLGWPHSSLKDFIAPSNQTICNFQNVIDMSPSKYRNFVLKQKDYQRQLSLIKNILIDNYSG